MQLARICLVVVQTKTALALLVMATPQATQVLTMLVVLAPIQVRMPIVINAQLAHTWSVVLGLATVLVKLAQAMLQADTSLTAPVKEPKLQVLKLALAVRQATGTVAAVDSATGLAQSVQDGAQAISTAKAALELILELPPPALTVPVPATTCRDVAEVVLELPRFVQASTRVAFIASAVMAVILELV